MCSSRETMKALTGLLAILLLGSSRGEDISKERSARPSIGDDRPGCENSGDANFAGDLYNRVRDTISKNEDLLISPLGISSMLGTLLFAVGPTSAAEISNFLYPDCANLSGFAPHSPILPLQRSNLTMITVAVFRRGINVEPDFVRQANELGSYVYRTGISHNEAAFNGFLHQKTGDSLYVHINPISPTTRLLFLNRVKFAAQFEQSFQTKIIGRNLNLVAERARALHAYFPELKADVLGLRLKDTNAFLLILLPDRETDIPEVEQNLRQVDVRKLPRQLTTTLVNITLRAAFKYQNLYLREALERAGIATVFNRSTADLTGFRSEVPLTNVWADCMINLSASGINAQSDLDQETDSVDTEADSVEPLEFNALKPIVYAVVDSRHVYLMGRFLGQKDSQSPESE